jgi:hypothetical protein
MSSDWKVRLMDLLSDGIALFDDEFLVWLAVGVAVAGVCAVLLLRGFFARATRAPEARDRSALQWSISIWEGSSPLALGPSPSVVDPVLTARDVTDVEADFVADPFMVRWRDGWFMFFEVMESRTRRGSIGVASSPDGLSWKYEGVVLREPFHLSFPCTFQCGSDFYMVPESHTDRAVRLYRARRFPFDWKRERTLLSGQPYVDPSLFQHGGKWWMFTAPYSNDELRLHVADAPSGPWREHPSSPVIVDDPHISRPAGRVLAMDGRLLRFAQDDNPFYGRQVFAFEITELTESVYREARLGTGPVLAPSGSGWNSEKMHHLDAHAFGPNRWIACVDGTGVLNAGSPESTPGLGRPLGGLPRSAAV